LSQAVLLKQGSISYLARLSEIIIACFSPKTKKVANIIRTSVAAVARRRVPTQAISGDIRLILSLRFECLLVVVLLPPVRSSGHAMGVRQSRGF
jgi:hypothetical protein